MNIIFHLTSATFLRKIDLDQYCPLIYIILIYIDNDDNDDHDDVNTINVVVVVIVGGSGIVVVGGIIIDCVVNNVVNNYCGDGRGSQ